MAKATLIIDAKMNIGQLEGAIGKIKSSLDSLRLPKNLEGQFNKNFTKLESLIQEFKGFQGVSLNKKESQQMMKVSSAISSQWRNISVMLKDFADVNNIDLNKIGLKEAAVQLDKVAQAQERYNQARNKAKQSGQFLKNQEQIKIEEKKLKSAKNKRISKSVELDNYKTIKNNEQANLKAAEETVQKYQKINEELKEAVKIKEKLEKDFSDSKEFQSKRPLNQKGQPLSESSLKGKITKIGKNLASLNSNSIIKNQLKDKNLWNFGINDLEKLFSEANNKNYSSNALKEQVTSLKEYIELRKQLQLLQNSENLKDSDKIQMELENQKKNVESLQKKKEALEKDQSNAKKTIEKNSTLDQNITKKGQEIAALDIDIERYTQKLESLRQVANNIIITGTVESWEKLKNALSEVGVKVDDLTQDASGFEKISERIGEKGTEEFEKIKQILNEITKSAEKGKKATEEIGKKRNNYEQAFETQNQFDREIDSMRSRIQYFFGLNNAINLFQRGLRQAYETVKELDNAMTETAVVTDFSVGDMWDQLPRYTKAANDLGATTLGAYETMTLFYQQGLNTDQAFALGTETMKMARIANLDYANATNLMTAALRGFNMELNEASAKKVNDVYSELAAITAADTQEIASAMTKTASIANSANMEFETTAAFLSQIIETTRESAETAGTAMKTIVARFTEVKKLGQSGGLTGKDAEGEVININKIDAALKTIGMSLSGFISGEQGLDDILLELASKWDSLDIATQRYIATTAAGSRQQSRFLAMMSDYDRTLELVNAAQNSTGAGEEQFAKTQDSLKSKLNALSNAWNEFTMGLANNKAIKFAVDSLTKIINLVNKLTSGLGSLGGLLKIGVGASLLRGGGTLAQTGVNWLAGTLTGASGKDGGVKRRVLEQAGFDFNAEENKALNTKAGLNKAYKDHVKTQFLLPWTGSIKGIKNSWKNFVGTNEGYGKYQEAWKNYQHERKYGSNIAGRSIQQQRLAMQQATQAVLTNQKYKKGTGFFRTGTRLSNSGFLGMNKMSNKLARTKGIGKITKKLGLGAVEGGKAAVAGYASLAIALGEVAAVAAAAGISLKALYDLSPVGQIKQIKEMSKALEEGTQKSIQQYEKQKEAYENYLLAESKIGQAKNQKEREQAISDNNSAILSLLDSDASLSNNIIEESGQLKFLNRDLVNNAIKSLEEKQFKLGAANDLAKGLQARLESQIARDQSNNLELGYLDVDGNYLPATEANKKKALKYKSESVAKELEAENYEREAFKKITPDSIKNSDIGDKVATALADNIDFEKSVGAFNGRNIFESKEEAARKYKEYFGIEASDMEVGEIQKANRMYEVANDFMSEEAGLMEKMAHISGSRTGKEFLDFISGDSTGDLAAQKQSILNNTELRNIAIELADKQGLQLEEYLDNQVKANQENRKANRKEIIKSLGKQGLIKISKGDIDKDGKLANKEEFLKKKGNEKAADLFRNISYQQEADLANLLRNTSALGLNGNNAVWQNLTKLIGTPGDSANTQKNLEWLNSIDFSNPIQAFKELKKSAESSDESIAKISKDFLIANRQALGSSAQIKHFLSSAEFGPVEEKINDIIASEGEISGDNIRDLAEECESLNDILENTGATAEGLAEALNLIESGDLSLSDLTDSIMAALGAFESIKGVTSEAVKDAETFDPGQDENVIAETIKKHSDTLKANIDKGAYGNTQSQNILEHYFGKDALKDAQGNMLTGDAFINKQKELFKIMSDNSSNMYNAWKDLAYDRAPGGKALVEEQQGILDKLQISESGGKIKVDGYKNFNSTEELVQALTKVTGFSENWAQAMLGDMYNYSPDMKQYFEGADIAKAIDDFIRESNGVVDESEIATFGKIFGDEAAEALSTKIDQEQLLRTDFKNEDGSSKTGKDLQDEINRAYNKSQGVRISATGQEFFRDVDGAIRPFNGRSLIREDSSASSLLEKSNFAEGGKYYNEKSHINPEDILDIDAFQGKLNELEVPAEQWEDAVNGMIESTPTIPLDLDGDSVSEEYHIITKEIEGQQVEIPVRVGQTEAEATADFLQTQDWTQMANILVDAFTGINVSVEKDESSFTAVETAINELCESREVTITVNEVPGTKVDSGGNAAGGIVSSYAKGSANNTIRSGIALTGEEDPEIVWNKEAGYAYLAGAHGPEYNKLNPGDRVFNASETKKILANSRRNSRPSLALGGEVTPSYWSGYGGGSGGSSGGRGGKGGKEDEWKNELDWLYNLMEDIAELERDQEKYNKIYEDLLADSNATGHSLVELTRDQISNLYEQQRHQEDAYGKRLFEMQEYLDVNKQFAGYGTYNFEDQTIEIDWEKIDQITDKDQYKDVEDYIKGLEKIQDRIDTADDALFEINKQIRELEEKFTKTYTEFQNRVLDALVDSYQKQIDNQSNINNTIKDTNSSLFNSIQKALDQQRQDRENSETEKDLGEKERRLAFLRQDTSKNNLIEIKELEEELADARQDYTDELIDQKLTELQDQEDFAAEQREKEIELMQAQLEYAKISGELWEEVYDIIDTAIDPEGKLINDSKLVDLLKNKENLKGLSEVQGKVWGDELEKTFKEVVAYKEMGTSVGAEAAGKTVNFLDKEGKSLSGTVGKDGKVHVKDGDGKEWMYSGIKWDREKEAWTTSKDREEYIPPPPPPKPAPQPSYSQPGDSGYSGNQYWGEENLAIKQWQKDYNALHPGNEIKVDGYIGKETLGAMNHAEVEYERGATGNSDLIESLIKIPRHKKGGLADYTGLGWLDGTPSRPELVLNQQETQNFLKLKDVLSDFMRQSSSSTFSSNGDNYYDIHIDATIGSDYDVEKLTTKIKKEIVKDADYRNANVIRRRR